MTLLDPEDEPGGGLAGETDDGDPPGDDPADPDVLPRLSGGCCGGRCCAGARLANPRRLRLRRRTP